MTDLQEVRFPMLLISRGGLLDVSDDEVGATVCGQAALTSGHFTSATIIDVAGNRFRIRKATKVANVGPFFGFRITRSRHIRVRFDLERQPNVDLANAKELVLKAMDLTRDLWDAREDAADVRDQIKAATSLSEVFDLVRGS